MTQYQKNLPVSEVAFPPLEIQDNLPVILSRAGIKQMHMSESEKERFVTYYFDGLREQRLLGEDTLIVPSPNVATYDKKPEMSIWELTDEFKKTLNKDMYKFILINIANPDMVAHSGNLKASIEAIEIVDKALGEFVNSVLTCNGTLIVTADHGNAEELITYTNTSYYFSSAEGTVNTDHSNYPVPVIIASKALQKANKFLGNGTLGDIAPTILKMFNLEIPPVMTGKNLLVLNKQSLSLQDK